MSQASPGLVRRWLDRKIVRDVGLVQIGETFNLGVSFVTSVLLARLLEPSGYGVYALIYALYGMLTLTGDLGLGPATVTKLSASLAGGRREDSAELAGYFIKLSLVLGGGLTILGLAVGPAAAGAVYHNRAIGWLAALLVANLIIGLPRNLARVIWQSSRMMGHYAGIEIARGVVRLGLVLALVLAGWGVAGAVAAEVISTLAASVASIPLLTRLTRRSKGSLPGWGEMLAQARQVPLGKHFAFGLKIVIDHNVVRVLEAAPFLILGAVGSTAAVGWLRVAWGAINLALNALQAIARNLAVRLPQLRETGEIDRLGRIYYQAALAGLAISLTGVGLLALLAPWLVKLVYGAQFLPAVEFIRVIAPAACLSGFFLGLGSLYRALDRMGLVAGLNFIQMLIYLPLGYAAIKAWQGLGGAVFIGGRMLVMNLIGFGAAAVILRRERNR